MAIPDIAPPQTGKPYDPSEAREKTRGRLAFGLAILLAITGLSLIALVADGVLKVQDAKDLGDLIFSPIVVLTGTALGFYFGVQHGGSSGS